MKEMLKLEDIEDGMMRKRAIGNRDKNNKLVTYILVNMCTTRSNFDMI